MNDPQHNLHGKTDPPDLLDQLTQHLREQPIPPLPPQCIQWSPPTVAARRDTLRDGRLSAGWLVASVAALLLMAVGATYWAGRSNQVPMLRESMVMERRPDEAEGVAIVRDSMAVLDARFEAMQRGLDELDDEIAVLKHSAQLLDARRKAEALLNAMANIGDARRAAADES